MIQVARMLLETRGKRSEVNKLILDKYWGRFLFLNGKKKSLSSCKREYRQCTYCLPFPVSLERKRKNNPDSGPRNVKPLLLCTAVLSVQNKQNDAKVVKDAEIFPSHIPSEKYSMPTEDNLKFRNRVTCMNQKLPND